MFNKIRRFELMLYRKITNFIEKRRASYWDNDKYHLGTSVKSDGYIDVGRPNHKNLSAYNEL